MDEKPLSDLFLQLKQLSFYPVADCNGVERRSVISLPRFCLWGSLPSKNRGKD
jgi:hypothetical protein